MNILHLPYFIIVEIIVIYCNVIILVYSNIVHYALHEHAENDNVKDVLRTCVRARVPVGMCACVRISVHCRITR